MTSLSVVLPVKSSANPNLIEELKSLDAEILIQREPGISNAVWFGMQKATNPIVAVMDGDGTHKVEDLEAMLTILENGADLVVGTRVENHYPCWRQFITNFFNWFARHWLGFPYRDPMSAFFVGKKETIKFTPSKSCKFGLEILYNFRGCIEEYPISHDPLANHKSHMKLTEGIYLMWQLLRLKLAKKTTLIQALGFAVVGFFGTLVNGIVYSLLSDIPILNLIPFPFFFLSEISLAWGIGILAGFVFNFVFDKWLVFKA